VDSTTHRNDTVTDLPAEQTRRRGTVDVVGAHIARTTAYTMMRALVVALVVLSATAAFAGTVRTAATCSANSVQASVDASADNPSDPDVVIIPAGDCTWATGITITKSLIIKGAGSGAIVHGAAVSPCPCTIVRDGIATNTSMVQVSLKANAKFRIAHIDFEFGGGANKGSAAPGVISFYGPSTSNANLPQVRADHLKFGDNPNKYILFNDVVGVTDQTQATGAFRMFSYTKHANWDSQPYGNGSWAAPSNFGSDRAVFIEDLSFVDTYGGTGTSIADGDSGARIVVRKSDLQDTQQVVHEVGAAYFRSNRSLEVYSNNFVWTGLVTGNPTARNPWGGSGVSIRGGTGIVHSNNYNAQFGSNSTFVKLANFRDTGAFWPGICDGTGAWDLNDGVVYDSGTHTGPNGATTLTDGTKSWATGAQWAPGPHTAYSVHNVTRGTGAGIDGNTTNTLTPKAWEGHGTQLTFNTGDSYQILRATVCMDQPGRGQSDLITGTPPQSGWVHNAPEPIYAVNNTSIGIPFMYGEINSSSFRAQSNLGANSDYYGAPGGVGMGSCVGAFNGSCGTGQGSVANRPTTCTTGVAYWVTDEGSWDTTKSANTSGRLYKCTSTNTWTLFYTPFTYPHSLRTSGVLADDTGASPSTSQTGSAAPAAPTNLKVQ
jgi:hypothetical protein